MVRLVRPIAVFCGATVLCLAAYNLTGGALSSTSAASVLGRAPLKTFGGAEYELSALELMDATLHHVHDEYVEPERVDFERMFAAGLDAVELRVPTCMFRREPGGSMLHVEVGDYRTVLEVPAITSRQELLDQFKAVVGVLEEHLDVDDIPISKPSADPLAEVEYALVNGVLGTLDPHSVLLPPDDSKEMDVENEGEFGGLGITIVDREGRLIIEYPLKDTPADRAGLVADDHIIRIDGESTINMTLEEAVDRLRGPVGSKVTIHVARDGLTEPLVVPIVRATIKLNPVEGQVLDGNLGYLSVKSFHANVHDDMTDLLAKLNRETGGLAGLVLDLRGNPGGYLNQAVKVSDLFLDDGIIVSTIDRDLEEKEKRPAKPRGTERKYPIVVLVNSSSASASEIVAGALRNNDRAVIVGERSFGKGSVQNLHQLYNDSKLKLTISKYLTPGRQSIQSIGIPADIELVPSVIERVEEDGRSRDMVLMHWRERVRREVDLDKHLERMSKDLDPPAYSLRYVQPYKQDRRSGELDLSHDQEVELAAAVLRAAGPKWRRTEVLGAAAPVVAKFQKRGSAAVEEAFSKLGIDWSDGKSLAEANLDVVLDIPDGVLRAGERAEVALVVTNRGTEPIRRLSAVSADGEVLGNREWFFGRLDPGETRRFVRDLTLPDGYPTETAPLSLVFRDTGNASLSEFHTDLRVQGRPLPRLAWTWSVRDAGEGADRDGVIEVGEEVLVDLEVRNIGTGPTSDAVARIANHSGRALDIVRGTVEPGYMVDDTGARCVVLEAGIDGGTVVGDPATGAARIAAGDPPRYAEGCVRRLAPGGTWNGSFAVRVNEKPADYLELELSIGDSEAYDYASVYRSGFTSYFRQVEKVRFEAGRPAPASESGTPPQINITRAPASLVTGSRVTLSGVVTDDVGVAHVLVFAGEDKVFFQGSPKDATVKSVPFSADIQLEPGQNTLVVLATDEDGLKASASVVTLFREVDLHAATGSDEAPAPQ